MHAMKLKTPLRYPGGKRKLANFMQQLISHNNLTGCTYAEPFAGGAGLAIELLKRNVVSHVYLNDIDKNIFYFWESVIKRTDELCSLIEKTPVSMEEWYLQKEKIKSNDPLTRGFATFFLNRTNRSGIIWGGVIGGKNQTGKWKIDCRYNKIDLIEKIRSISSVGNKISFFNLDAEVFLDSVCSKFSESSLIYLDPPYYIKGSGLYENHYKHEDHKRLAEKIQGFATPWIVSYDNNENINKFYESQEKIIYSIHYSAQDHIRGKEVIFCENCFFPPNASPL